MTMTGHVLVAASFELTWRVKQVSAKSRRATDQGRRQRKEHDNGQYRADEGALHRPQRSASDHDHVCMHRIRRCRKHSGCLAANTRR